MSDDEKALLIGKLILEHQAATQYVAALRTKAAQLAAQLEAAADVLKERGDLAPGVLPTRDVLAELLTAIAGAERRLADLTKQRSDLGV